MAIFTASERRELSRQARQLRMQGLRYSAIGRRMGLTAAQARYLAKLREPAMIVTSDEAPQTLGAEIWHWPPLKVRRTHTPGAVCPSCPLSGECAKRILEWGRWMVGCERPLVKEIVHG